ncbi:zinc finger MIZ domain-containing protein 1-like isoform X1 [Limulus polyphemus]|uniref:Zinc finger MIZ domain-containing protein 1-like isoform X1 n=2 Tax=Limulus polyphemus TaxID=6850 RepID=A0ABM1SBD9_LIMPO|nr:zinc finger MIZ domain-containing protein 1-like isoform X1 [Limulus polyphemus]
MTAMATAMDRHIQQTNERLQCIKEALGSPAGFQSAARELLEWCSDSRAFQKVFEQNLIACLTVVNRVAAQQGFDLDLGYRLLAVCAAQRDKFSSKSASLLTVWCEDLGRLLLLRHQKTREGDGLSKLPPGMHQPLQKTLPPGIQGESTMTALRWQQTPPNGHGSQQLSVVTTVWGMSPNTQSGPLAHNSYNGTNTSASQGPYSQGQHGYPGVMTPKPYPPQGMPSRQPTPTYNGYRHTPTPMGTAIGPSMTNGGPAAGGDYQGSSAALNAATLVARAAAAATATATATASVVAFQDQHQHETDMGNQYHNQMQNMPSQQFQQGYGPPGPQQMSSGPPVGNHMSNHMNNTVGGPMSSMPGSMIPINSSAMSTANTMNPQIAMNGSIGVNKSGMQGVQNIGGSGQPMYPLPSPAMGPQTRARSAPYPNPSQYMVQKRQAQYGTVMAHQYGPSIQQYGPVSQQPYNTAQFSGGQGIQYPKLPPQFPPSIQQQHLPSSGYPPQQQMRQSMRPQAPAYTPQQEHYYTQNHMNGVPQQTPYGNHYVGPQSFQRNINYQHSPIPGNPTPPLTPASNSIPPYISPNSGDIKPSYQDIKPQIPPTKDDELRLTFPVRDGIILPPFRLEHNLAVSNHFFQLKPSVYQTLMWRSDLELQLKCFHHEDRQMNTNWPASVQVSVNATPVPIDRGENKTSHKPLYLKDVCQPGRNTIQITVTACCCSHLFLLHLVHRPTVRSVLQGLLRNRLLPAEHCISKIKRNFNSVAATNSTMNGEDVVEQTAIKVSLKCPITFKRVTLPARGQDCKHIQCFDLESYLQMNCERGAWRCPVCNKTAYLEGLEVDQYIWAILTNLSNSEVEEVTMEATASWKPISPKQEHDQDPCAAQKKFKAMSPGSMTMPTTSTWEVGQALSPYSAMPPPDMQSIANGSITNGHNLPNGMNYRGMNGSYEFSSDYGSPLSRLNDSVASLDPLVAMEKSLNQQMCPPGMHDQSSQQMSHPATSASTLGTSQGHQSSNYQQNAPLTPSSTQNQGMMQHGPNTPHTPHTPHTPGNGGPPSIPPPSVGTHGNSIEANNNNSNSNPPNSQPSSVTNDNSLSHTADLSDLNFDPAAVIDGEGQGQEGLNLLPESVVDPMELLCYLDPPEISTSGNSSTTSGSTTNTTTVNSSATTSTSNSTNDDILAFF